jgi:hypothetical protein
MNHLRRRGSVRDLAAIASALLWGAVELVALARSRWSTRLRHEPGVPQGERRA